MFRLFFYLSGYYSILISGYGAERFINLCKIKNIYLWDLKQSHQDYSMKISASDYQNLDEIVALQKQLLDTAAMVCKENGVLVYSTCTLNKKENEKQIESFLKRHEEFTLVSERSYFPYEYDTDGFYMAKLVKSGKI